MKLSLAQKIFSTNILYAIPVLVTMAFMITGINSNISFATLETSGNQYQKPLVKLLFLASQHKLQIQKGLLKTQDPSSDIKVLNQEIDQVINQIELVNQKLGGDLQFTKEGLAQRQRDEFQVETLKSDWNSLRAISSDTDLEDSEKLHQQIVRHIRGMITHLGDTSNLILDPDLDSYYIMDLTLLAIPQLQDRLQELSTFVGAIINRGKITLDERIQLNIYIKLLKTVDLDRISSSALTAINEDKNFYGTVSSLQTKVPQDLKELQDVINQYLETISKFAATEFTILKYEDFSEISQKSISAAFNFWNSSAGVLDSLLEKRIISFKSSRFTSILLCLLALVFAYVISWYIIKSIKKSITHAVEKLNESVQATNVSSNELVKTSQNLASSTSSQSQSIENTTDAISKISILVNKSLDNANHSEAVAEQNHLADSAGQNSVREVIEAIFEINKSNENIVLQINESYGQIADVVQIISEIGVKTNVINDIVFQTKILSFNASVEAARAGEHGRGFSVVAEEIGSLARMSGDSAKEITDILNASMEKVSSIVAESKSKIERLVGLGKFKVEAGTEVANKCGTSLEDIVQTEKQLNDLVREISQFSQKQVEDVAGISDVMRELDSATKFNTAMSNETAMFSQKMLRQAENLSMIVGIIENEVLGKSSQS